ncbi:MAG TPA: magnesium transporter, partial [Spirochaetaceae bacterium]|nr:magnesium transporter [Spirochaetaceae bacterium]
VTVDDIIDVIEQEDTEDISKMAAVLPSDEEYLKTNVFVLAKNRIVWLVFLMLSSIVASRILSEQEKVFTVMPVLVAFIPMLMDAGGNAGSQTSSIIIRSMAIGEIGIRDYLKVVFKEIRVAVITSFALAACNMVRMLVEFPSQFSLGISVSLSLFLTVIAAKMLGCSLPFLAKMLHVDPALMASPIITTMMDAFSLVCYFYVCKMIIGI